MRPAPFPFPQEQGSSHAEETTVPTQTIPHHGESNASALQAGVQSDVNSYSNSQINLLQPSKKRKRGQPQERINHSNLPQDPQLLPVSRSVPLEWNAGWAEPQLLPVSQSVPLAWNAGWADAQLWPVSQSVPLEWNAGWADPRSHICASHTCDGSAPHSSQQMSDTRF